MGFEEYRNPRRPDSLTVRRLLPRSFDLPSAGPRTEVTVSFYEEPALYSGNSSMQPISVHRVAGKRGSDRSIMLERRVLGLRDDEPQGHDLVIKIEVDGLPQCFCKAKHKEARDAGVRRDSVGDSFYIDCIRPTTGE
jgi:hypothetical protein